MVVSDYKATVRGLNGDRKVAVNQEGEPEVLVQGSCSELCLLGSAVMFVLGAIVFRCEQWDCLLRLEE